MLRMLSQLPFGPDDESQRSQLCVWLRVFPHGEGRDGVEERQAGLGDLPTCHVIDANVPRVMLSLKMRVGFA